MKRFYFNLYNLIWFCVSRHCSFLSNYSVSLNSQSYSQFSQYCLDEIAWLVQEKLEQVKESRCLIRLFKAYVFSLKTLTSMRQEMKLSAAQKSYPHTSSTINLGKYTLIIFLMINTLIGLAVSYTYQYGQFSLFSSLIAVLSYATVVWCLLQARALLLFKTTLLILITLTSFNAFFWNIWQSFTNTTNCYSEICTLMLPNSLFQGDFIKPILIIFWVSFFITLNLKNPVTTYLTYKESQDRRL